MSLDQDTVIQILMSERMRLFAYIWSIVRDEHMAEDVFQEVSILVLHKREELRDAAALPTWLRKAARLAAIAGLRRQDRRPVLMDDDVLDRLEPFWAEPSGGSSARAEALRECVEALTPRARQLLRMRYVEGLSGRDVARRTGRKLESVYMALSRLHNRLASCVRQRLTREPRRA